MNCTNCGKPLPSGVSFCPSCNAATPYNTTGQNLASPYDPTVAASSYGNPPSAPGSEPANPYGSSSNYPPQSPYTSYGAAGTPQPPSYGNNTPNYGSPQPQNFYTPPPALPQSGTPPYGYGASGTPGYTPGMQPGGFGTGVPPKRRSKVGLIVGISLLVVVLLCGGIIALFAIIGKNAATTVQNATASVTAVPTTAGTTPVPTTASNGGVPSQSDVVPAAAKILFNPQMSSAIDSNDEPTKITNTFAPDQDAYLTFQEDSQGKNGYIQVKWYQNGSLVSVRLLQHSGQNDHGYFSHAFTDSGSAQAAMYWCTVESCSDAKLAQVVSFTVSAASAVPPSNTGVAAVIGGNRRSI